MTIFDQTNPSKNQSKLTLRSQITQTHWIIPGLIFGLATILRLYALGEENLWVDEMNSLEDSKYFSWLNPGVRPLYYSLLHIWMQWFNDESGWRLLSVILGIGCVVLTYDLGHRLFGKNIAQLSSLMMAISPIFINHSQEIRMYPLMVFWAILGSIALLEYIDRPSYWRVAAWTICRLLAILAFPISIALLVPDGLILIVRFRQQRRWLFSAVSGVLFIGAMLLPIALTQLAQKAQDYYALHGDGGDEASFSVVSVIAKLTSFTVFWPLETLNDRPSLLLFYKGITLLLLLVLGISLLGMRRNRSLQLAATWTIGGLGSVLLADILVLGGKAWITRYLLFAAPFVFILLAVGLSRLWSWHRWVGGAVALLYILAVWQGLAYYYSTAYRDDWRGLAQAIQPTASPEAIVYYAPDDHLQYSLPFYYDGKAPLHIVSRSNKEREEATVLTPADLADLPQNQERLWLACWSFCHDEAGIDLIAQTVLGAEGTIKSQQSFRGHAPGSARRLELLVIEPEVAQ
ncbi:MAG: glycosyltransferase family 39 protein [Thainema sp.]